MVALAKNNFVVCLDNVSFVKGDLSDACCRLATGGGLGGRALYTDNDEAVFEARRPIIINGIPDLVSRPDFADRVITLNLPAIPDSERKGALDIVQAFEQKKPHIYGAILNALSAGLRHISSVELESLPRMADFVKCVVACEQGAYWEKGKFLSAYDENRQRALIATIEANPLASLIAEWHDYEGDWTGTATELWSALKHYQDGHERRFNPELPSHRLPYRVV